MSIYVPLPSVPPWVTMTPRNDEGMSTLEYHVLLALATGPRYGYAIKGAVETESEGVLTPLAGTLYRVIARLITRGWVAEATEVEAAEPHPGRERKYYGLTPGGREALRDEAHRLRGAAALAEERLGATEGRP
jgi:DNA-binding PadR family transcriptional regulator